MATYSAIAAVCDAVVYLLRTNYAPERFENAEMDFKVYVTGDFQQPMQAGVSLFLYRVSPNGVLRTPPGRTSADPRHSPLPVDLHFFLTVWGKEAPLQNALTGWLMRCMEDNPILTPSLLNHSVPGAFSSGETVEVVLGELSVENMMQIWDRLQGQSYRLSIPYIARGIYIESTAAGA
jgi:hypothetical protein